MSRTTNESDDGMLSKYHSESPLIDDGNGGSSGGGVVLKKGPWTSSEDAILVEYVRVHGEGNWNAVQKHSGLSRCGKSCRLRWANHLRPHLKKGAFSPQEEATILELHAKIGNKWARMATFMPGRTDNEIKNYWNTRVKRRQRAGLPLYPPELSDKVKKENQLGQNSGAMGCGDLGKHDPLQANNFEIPDVIFKGLKRTGDPISNVSDYSDLSTALMNSMDPSQYYGLAPQMVHHRQKRLRESSDVFPEAGGGCVQNGYHPQQIDQFHYDTCHKMTGSSSFGHSFPQDLDLDPDPDLDLDPGQSLLSFDPTQGVHSLQNGNSSASRPGNGSVKLELPSLQYHDADFSAWDSSPRLPFLEPADAYIQSPLRIDTFDSDLLAPQNSGLLDVLILESAQLSSAKHSSEKSSTSSSFTAGYIVDPALNFHETEWDGVGIPSSPFGHSVSSILNDGISPGGSSFDDTQHAETNPGIHVKPDPAYLEQEPKTQMEIIRPDALLDSLFWLDRLKGSGVIGSFRGKDMGFGSSSSQGFGFDRCSYWHSMPSAVTQTPNTAVDN